jgi:plasmid stabilization system protein ParE
MKLRFTPGALADISEIADFIRVENPQAAESVRASILESLQNLTRFPKAGRPQSIQGVRKLVTASTGIWSIILPTI